MPLPVTDAWRSVPPHLCEVIQRALRPRPADRFPDAAAFVEALATAQADDATAFMAAPTPAPVPDADATEFLAATAGVPVVSPPVREVPPAREAPPAAATPTPTPSTRRPVLPKTPVVWIVPLLLLLAFAVWAARRGGDDPAPTTAAAETTAPDSGNLAVLDEEFLRLEGAAAQTAASRPAPTATPDPIGATTTPPAAVPVPPQPAPGQRPEDTSPAAVLAQAEAEITAAVHDVNKAWVDGDISRHVAHYGSRVDYYNSNNLPRAGVRRDRTRDLRRYDDRRIGIHAVEVQWQAPDRARVLVDKEWIFGDDGGRTRQGRGMQEYVFKRDEDDGKWYIVSEQLLTTTEARSPAEP